MLSFKPTFSFSSFTFIKSLLSSSSLSAIRVVSSAYLRLLIQYFILINIVTPILSWLLGKNGPSWNVPNLFFVHILWYYSQITLLNIKGKVKFLLASFDLIVLLYTTVKILFSKIQNIAYKFWMNMCQNGQANNKEHQKRFRKRGYTIQMLANYTWEFPGRFLSHLGSPPCPWGPSGFFKK